MKKNNLKSIILATVLVFCTSFVPNAYADEERFVNKSMTVSPPYTKIILTPGEVYQSSLRISNSSNSRHELRYSTHIGSFSERNTEERREGNGTVDHETVSNYNQIMDWITIDREGGVVAPGVTEFVNYTINVPENAPAGGQYATIIIRDEQDPNSANNGNVSINSTTQFASIIYAEIAGEAKEEGVVVENNVPSISFSSPLVASSVVKNNGNVHTDATYTLEVWPLFSDEEAYTNAENPKTSLILPESEKYNTVAWEDAPTLGIFRVRQTIKIFGEESIVEKTVIICPLWLLLVIVFAVVVIIVWFITRSKSRKKSQK